MIGKPDRSPRTLSIPHLAHNAVSPCSPGGVDPVHDLRWREDCPTVEAAAPSAGKDLGSVVAAVVVRIPHVAREFRDESLVFGEESTVAPPSQNSPLRHPGSISK